VVALAEGLRHGPELAEALASLGERLPQFPGLPLEPVPSQARAVTVPAGSVRVLRCGGEVAQAQAIATELRRAHTEHGTDFSDMAVVVRSGRGQLPAIARALAAAGIPVAVAADEIVLAASQAVRPLLLALQVVGRGSLEPAEAELLLTSPLGGFDPIGLRRLLRQWRRAHPEVTATSAQEVFGAALADPGWAQADTPEQVRLRQLAGLLRSAREACEAGRRVDEIAWLVWEGTRWPARLRAESLRGGPAARHADRDLDAVTAFFELAAESSAGAGERGVRALLAEVAAQQIPADRERESRLGARGVQVLTAHRAKGREWSLVVVAGVQEGAWPAAGVLEPLRLGSDGIGLRPDPREQLTEERRLFHLACSRARDHLVVTAAAGTEGEANQPSRFLAELGVPAGGPQPGPPVTLAELTARLRRILLDPGSGDAARDAAAGVLADLSTEVDDSGRAVVPAADPASWWGVRALSSVGAPASGPIRLSPSQVRELLTCPRHHFLNRTAHAGPPPAASASLGTVLHLLVQHANSGGLTAGEEAGYLDAAWEHLRFEAGWLSAVERAEAASSIGRFLAWRETAAAELVGVEVPFELDLELGGLEVSVVGAVDRLERVADGRLRVVDFKTGRTVPTRGDVAGMEQLGIYQLAVRAGVLGDGDTAGALAVYLRHPGARDELPKVLTQDSLAEVPHLGDDAEARQFPTWVEHRVWRAARVVADGVFPASPGGHCRRCPFADSCPASGRGEQVV
jgi:RecB family exonuclease